MTESGNQQSSASPPTPSSRPALQAKATSAIVAHESWGVALEHATDQVISPGDSPPDVLLLFASGAYGAEFGPLVRAARQRTGAGTLIGCSASGFLAGDTEVEDQPGLALMALWLPGANLFPVRLHQEGVDLLDDPETWREVHQVSIGAVNSWLMFAEPFRIDAHSLVRGLQGVYPEATIMGGLASGMIEDRKSCVFFDDQVYEEGGVALGIGGSCTLEPHVSQGCDPVGESWTITAADHNLLLGISNRPALSVLQDTVNSLTPDQRDRAHNNLVVGLADNEYRDSFDRGDFLVRGILGIDPKRGSISVGGVPRVGQTVQFQLRDAISATSDLESMMQSIARAESPETIVAAVMCTCDGRGQALFGEPNHDTSVVRSALGRIPLAGLFCIGEIGPLGSRAVLHGFTSTVGIIRHRGDTA